MLGFARKKTQAPFVSAIIIAADLGLDEIYDFQITMRTVSSYDNCRSIDEIVMVCPQRQIAQYYDILREHEIIRAVSIIGGGGNRQESVFRGVKAADSRADYFLIHDEPRPLISIDDIERCLDGAIEYGAATLGLALSDTVKICDKTGVILSTPNRAELVTLQAPRAFRGEIYRAAMNKAISQGLIYESDCHMIRREGIKIFVCRGSTHNIKITCEADLALAQAILQFREEGIDQWQTCV